MHVHRDLLRQVSVGHRNRHVGDVAHLVGQIARHRVDVVGEVLPGAGHAGHERLPAQLALRADLARHPGHLRREGIKLFHHLVYRSCRAKELSPERMTFRFQRHGLREIALRHRANHPRHLASGADQIVDEFIDRLDIAFPRATGL